jgi:hypothetical protein
MLVAATTVLGFTAPVTTGSAWAIPTGRQAPSGSWPQVAELVGSDTEAQDNFGASVAISGATAVVGAVGHAKAAGRAYVFTRGPTGWRQAAELVGSDTRKEDNFGGAVAILGGTIVVGATGAAGFAGRAYVFTRGATGWRQTAELVGSGIDADAAKIDPDDFGTSVAISGGTVVVGADDARNGGRVYVFTRGATGWRQVAELVGSDTTADAEFGGDFFGTSVAISGATVVVGASGHAAAAGRAYVFTRGATGWRQTAELVGSGIASKDTFGSSVAISGATVVVGADGGTVLRGAPNYGGGRAYVFTQGVTGWRQVAELVGSDTVAGGDFGGSVAISGGTVLVGDDFRGGGRAYVFTKGAPGWRQIDELVGSDTVYGDDFGGSVSISGATAVVGAFEHGGENNPIGGATNDGSAYVFQSRGPLPAQALPSPAVVLAPPPRTLAPLSPPRTLPTNTICFGDNRTKVS